MSEAVRTVTALTVLLLLAACGTDSSIPEDLEVSIISEDVIPDVRRSLDVRLSRAVDEDVLTALAQQLRSQDSRDFDRTLMVYYLPGMEVGAGGWATSDFDPNLEVRILGVPPAEVGSRMDRLREQYGEQLIGAWENNQVGFASTYILLQEGGSLAFERIFPDGSSQRIKVVEQESNRGRRVHDPENQFGEYFLIRNGRLELHDEDGLVFTAGSL